jgi:predicted RecB family nuclease
MRGVQCLKSLYLNQFHPELRNELTDQQQRLFDTGQKVGKLAQDLFPGGDEVIFRSFENMQETVSHTSELIEEGAKIIYEAGFQFNEVLVLTDILVKGNEGWRNYEVKSSTGMKPQYILDTAVQYYVVSNAGLPIEDIYLVYINNQYVRLGEIDVEAMFSLESVLEPVLEIQNHIADIIPELKMVLQLDEIPQIDIGEHCHDPVDCDFTEYCWKHIPSNSVFEISRLKNSDKFKLYGNSILTIDKVPNDFPLNDNQRLQVECFKTKSNHIDREAIQSFLRTIQYPIHFMDFETFSPAIPLYINTRPYQHIPFQYSLHIKESKQGKLKHFEYLGMPPEDPRKEFLEHLLLNIRETGDIIVYNRAFEVGRLNELMRDFSEYEARISNIIERVTDLIERVTDLMYPFQKRYYYSPEMHGSYSIKVVLPALVPNLDYSDLVISGGGSAMYAYEQLLEETDENIIREKKRNLLEYCKRDTLAMVKILEVLEDL